MAITIKRGGKEVELKAPPPPPKENKMPSLAQVLARLESPNEESELKLSMMMAYHLGWGSKKHREQLEDGVFPAWIMRLADGTELDTALPANTVFTAARSSVSDEARDGRIQWKVVLGVNRRASFEGVGPTMKRALCAAVLRAMTVGGLKLDDPEKHVED